MSNLRKALDLNSKPATQAAPISFAPTPTTTQTGIPAERAIPPTAPVTQSSAPPAPAAPAAPAPALGGFAALVAQAAAAQAPVAPPAPQPQTVAAQVPTFAISQPQLPPQQMESIFNSPVTLVNDMTTWPDGAISNEQFSAQLKLHIDDVANHMGRGDVGDALNRALVFIGQHPKMKDLVLPLDIQVLIKALQAASGIVLAEKSEKSSARSKKKAEQNELLAMMGNIFSGAAAPTGFGS